MKKLILAAFALTTAASVFAQGTIYLGNRFTGTPAVTTHIYAPLGLGDMVSITGNAATGDTPAGTANYGGRALIGASGPSAQYGGNTTLAQFVAAVGFGVDAGSLMPVGQTTTFRTGTGAGFLGQIVSTLTGPGFDKAGPGEWTFSIVAWDNSSGLYPTWAEAKPAWENMLIAAGMMKPFNINSLGGGTVFPVYPNQVGGALTSFNLYFIPEPGSFALLGLGAAALLIFRRRK